MTQDQPPWGMPPQAPAVPAVPPVPDPSILNQPRPVDRLTCPVCSGTIFSEEAGRLETRWGMGGHVLTMKVCSRCGYCMFFYGV